MKKTDWAVLGCRVMALHLAIISLAVVPGIPEEITSWESLLGGIHSQFLLFSSLTLRLLFAILLWTLAPLLARLLFAYDKHDESGCKADAAGLASVVFFLAAIALVTPAYLSSGFSWEAAGFGFLQLLKGLLEGESLRGALSMFGAPVATDVSRTLVALVLALNTDRLGRFAARGVSFSWRRAAEEE